MARENCEEKTCGVKADMIAFDLDGVIADTEPLHKRAKERILSEIGCAASFDLDAFVGLPNATLWREVVARSTTALSPHELEKMQYDYIIEQLRDNKTPMSDGLPDLLQALDAAGVRYGICSSSNIYYVVRVLDFFSLTDRFSPVIAGDMVPNKKPAPDGYLKFIEKSTRAPDRIVAIEDSRAGIASATGAGLCCIGYINPTSGSQDLSEACMTVNGLLEVLNWLRGYAGY